MAGASRSRVVATLRDYLTCEYRAKIHEPSNHVFSKLNIPGHSVKVPQQNNFTDCGLYLLQYVEAFFQVKILYVLIFQFFDVGCFLISGSYKRLQITDKTLAELV